MHTTDFDKLRTLSKVIFTFFFIVAAALIYWTVVRADIILSRSDNPRLLEQELRIRRGTILDHNGRVLAVSEGGEDRLRRVYPIPGIGPAVGFYSIIHGTAGVESGYDDILRNDPDDWWTSLVQSSLHIPQDGRDIRLALDSSLQLSADVALGQNKGAVLLLKIDEEEPSVAWIRALVSHPGYDPNSLDEQFDDLGSSEDAPLLNRVTQGHYQPGMLLQPFIIASALEQDLISLGDQVADPDRVIPINGVEITCKTPPPESATWSDVLQLQCPGPIMDLADQLGTSGLDAAFSSFGFDRDPTLEIDTMTSSDEPLNDPVLAGIGQDNLSITPLRIGLALSAFVNEGQLPQPQLGEAVQDENGHWQSWNLLAEDVRAISAETAGRVLRTLSQEDNVFEHSSLVLSGPDDTTNAWYLGTIRVDDASYVAVVVVEDSTAENQALPVGRAVLSAARES